MTINVLNHNFSKIAVVDSYTSLMWCERYNEIGALDLEIEATTETVSIFRKGYYITRDDTDAIFRIEAVELDTSEDNNNALIIGAYDCKKILSQRIVWEQINFTGTVENYIRKILNDNVINPAIAARKINNFVLKAAKGFGDEIEQQITYDQIDEKIIELCKTYNYGWRVTYEDGQFYFDLYKGLDRSIDQTENPRVVFSPEYENLVSSKYESDISEYKNVALVGGEGEGKDRKKRAIGTASGLDRFEMFVDASSVSTNVEGDLVDYYELLVAEGKNKLAETALTTSFEGDVDAINSYVYKKDYNIGDVVTLENEYGISINARITEVIESWDHEGYTITPKFEFDEFANDTIRDAILSENGIVLTTENGIPLLLEGV